MTPRLAIALALILALQITAAAWWLPQKWQACQRLYNSMPAQTFCLLPR